MARLDGNSLSRSSVSPLSLTQGICLQLSRCAHEQIFWALARCSFPGSCNLIIPFYFSANPLSCVTVILFPLSQPPPAPKRTGGAACVAKLSVWVSLNSRPAQYRRTSAWPLKLAALMGKSGRFLPHAQTFRL